MAKGISKTKRYSENFSKIHFYATRVNNEKVKFIKMVCYMMGLKSSFHHVCKSTACSEGNNYTRREKTLRHFNVLPKKFVPQYWPAFCRN